MRGKMIGLGITMGILFSALLSVFFNQNQVSGLKIYTYQVGIYNEKENALDMINSLSKYELEGLSYVKNNQYYVIACLTMDEKILSQTMDLLNSIGIKGIEKSYLIDSKYKDTISNNEYSDVLEWIASYDT